MRSTDAPGRLQAQRHRLQCAESQTQLSDCCPLSRGGSRRLAILPSHTAEQVLRRHPPRHPGLLPKTPHTEAAQNRLAWCYCWRELPTCLIVCPRPFCFVNLPRREVGRAGVYWLALGPSARTSGGRLGTATLQPPPASSHTHFWEFQ